MLNSEAEEEWRSLSADQIRTYVRRSLLKKGLDAIKEIPDAWIRDRDEFLILSGFYHAHKIVSLHSDKNHFKFKSELEKTMVVFMKMLNEKEQRFVLMLEPPNDYLTTSEKLEILGMKMTNYYQVRKDVTNIFSIFRKKLIEKEND